MKKTLTALSLLLIMMNSSFANFNEISQISCGRNQLDSNPT
jgi:hypothetical protein